MFCCWRDKLLIGYVDDDDNNVVHDDISLIALTISTFRLTRYTVNQNDATLLLGITLADVVNICQSYA